MRGDEEYFQTSRTTDQVNGRDSCSNENGAGGGQYTTAVPGDFGLIIPGLIGASAVMKRMAKAIQRSAGNDFPVLISGESGTGKELVA